MIDALLDHFAEARKRKAYWSEFKKQTVEAKENEQGSHSTTARSSSGAADPAEKVDTATSRGHVGAAEEEAKTETEKVDAAAEGNADITASMVPDDAAETENVDTATSMTPGAAEGDTAEGGHTAEAEGDTAERAESDELLSELDKFEEESELDIE